MWIYVWSMVLTITDRFIVQVIDNVIEKSRLSCTDIAQRAGMSRDYTYKVLSGQKKTSERDYIIAICIALRMNLWRTQRALSLYPFPVLNDSDERSALITTQK